MKTQTFYFRARENNANIYRLAGDNQRAREMLSHIGTIIFQSKKIKLNQGEQITPEEEAEILEWIGAHKKNVNKLKRTKSEMLLLELQNYTHWIQAQANDEDVESIFDGMLLTLYDLRQTLVRRYADSLTNASENEKNKTQASKNNEK